MIWFKQCMVYPRACGGTPYARSPTRALCGLSPRVRGNQYKSGEYKGFSRSIPARAGEPIYDDSMTGQMRVYPRACGGTA